MELLPKAPKSGPPQKKGSDASRDWYEVVASHAGNVAKVSILAFIVALGYIIYAVYGGYLDANLDERKLANISFMGKVLAVAGAVGALSFIIATLHEVAYAVAAGLVGLGLIFGTPMLLLTKLTSPDSPAGQEIQAWTFRAGLIICSIALLRVLYQIVHVIKTGPQSRERAKLEEEERLGPKKVRRTRGIYSHCWDLPYCHDTIKELCPAYKERKNCWRLKRGCNCDPRLVETMIQSGAARVGKGQDKVSAKKQATADAYLRDAAGVGPKDGPRATGQTVSCKKCPIYGEHQRQKFNIVNPIAIIGTIALLVVSYPVTKEAYFWTVGQLAQFAARLTMGDNIDPQKWFNYLNTTPVQVFFFIIVSLFLLSYVLKFVEWVIFVKKL